LEAHADEDADAGRPRDAPLAILAAERPMQSYQIRLRHRMLNYKVWLRSGIDAATNKKPGRAHQARQGGSEAPLGARC
jgi:hypothetical protein